MATLANLPLIEARAMCYQWRGLVRVEFGRGTKPAPCIPMGYKGVKVWDRNAIAVMPLWFYPFYRLHREWQRFVFLPLMAIGIWLVDDGDYYVNGRWAFHQPFGPR